MQRVASSVGGRRGEEGGYNSSSSKHTIEVRCQQQRLPVLRRLSRRSGGTAAHNLPTTHTTKQGARCTHIPTYTHTLILTCAAALQFHASMPW